MASLMNSGKRPTFADLMSRIGAHLMSGSAERRAQQLYAMVVAQAREAAFYEAGGVPDTMEGRFDMIVLHLCLVLRRLRGEDGALMRVGQALFNAFCADMDGNLREMGVGDLAVPKRMKKFGEAFYGRAAAYDAALGVADDGPLGAALLRNVFGEVDAADGVGALMRYVRKADQALAAMPREALLAARWQFPALDTAERVAIVGGVHGQ